MRTPKYDTPAIRDALSKAQQAEAELLRVNALAPANVAGIYNPAVVAERSIVRSSYYATGNSACSNAEEDCLYAAILYQIALDKLSREEDYEERARELEKYLNQIKNSRAVIKDCC